jgi:hypothetical protein
LRDLGPPLPRGQNPLHECCESGVYVDSGGHDTRESFGHSHQPQTRRADRTQCNMNEGTEMVILSAPPLSIILQAETNADISTEPMVHPTSANRGDDRT